MNTLKQQYKELLLDGSSIEYKKISICNIKNHLKTFNNYRPLYQVHSDNPKMKFSDLYNNLDDAVDKFFDIRIVVDRGGY
jgi:hypothetical protein